MQEWADAWNLGTSAAPASDADYLAAVRLAGRGETPVFGMRLQYAFLAPLIKVLARLFPRSITDVRRIESAFGPISYVHLVRQDKLAQAVSMILAQQTGLWHLNADGCERERTMPPCDPVYDHDAIKAQVARLTRYDQGWQRWFERERIRPLQVSYEMLASDPATVIRDICIALSIDLGGAPPFELQTAKLDDAVSSAWIRRYQDIKGA